MPARTYTPGEVISGTVYQVIRAIGAGGMGTVYDVEDTSIGKRYVLKTLHPNLGDRQDLARRMQNEARTLARLHHPNIVEVVTAGVTGDDLKLPYYVMERLNGQNLRIVLQKKGVLELSHAYHIAIDLLEALDHAHDKGVIHRDVKPDNIFLHRTIAGVTVTKLLDFGIMGLLEQGRSGAETGGRFLGTVRYASPEQLRGGVKTPKMDIYAAGLVLYEMVAGRGPFDDEGDQKNIARAHIDRTAPPLSSFAADAPPGLEALVASALAKDPAERPRDAYTFCSELRALARALGGAARDRAAHATTGVALLTQPASTPPVPIIVRDGPPPTPISPVPPSPVLTPSSGAATPAMPPILEIPSAASVWSELPSARTTFKGMAPPTLSERTLEDAPSPPLALGSRTLEDAPRPPPNTVTARITSPPAVPAPAPLVPAVDRAATTHTAAPETPRMPMNDTDAMPPPAPSPVTTPGAPIFSWPQERPVEGSESGQVRSVAGAPPEGPRRSVPPWLMIAGAAGATAIAGLVLGLAWQHAARPADDDSRAEGARATAASAIPVITTPTLPPPALGEAPPTAVEITPSVSSALPVPPPSLSGMAAPQPTPYRPAPVRPRVTATPPSPPAPTPAREERPGPGF